METVDDLLAVARRHEDSGWIDDAIAVYRAVLSERPQDFDALLGLGRLLIGVGDFGAAADCLSAADSMSLPSAPLKVDLGVALENTGRMSTPD